MTDIQLLQISLFKCSMCINIDIFYLFFGITKIYFYLYFNVCRSPNVVMCMYTSPSWRFGRYFRQPYLFLYDVRCISLKQYQFNEHLWHFWPVDKTQGPTACKVGYEPVGSTLHLPQDKFQFICINMLIG